MKDWPWSWVRVAYNVQRIQSIHEMAQVLSPDEPERAVPQRWMMFNDEVLELWIKGWRGDESAMSALESLVGPPP